MHRVFGLRLGQNCGVRPAADKNFYFQLTVQKIRAFGVLSETYITAIRLTPISRLRSTVHIQTLKYSVISLKYKIIKTTISVTQFFDCNPLD